MRRIHRRDLNRTWEFLKLCFRDVNRETVEYQRPLSKRRFVEVYGEEDVDQLLFEVGDQIVGYRSFYKLDAAIFLAQKVETEPELLPPRKIGGRSGRAKRAKS